METLNVSVMFINVHQRSKHITEIPTNHLYGLKGDLFITLNIFM